MYKIRNEFRLISVKPFAGGLMVYSDTNFNYTITLDEDYSPDYKYVISTESEGWFSLKEIHNFIKNN